MDEFDDLEAYPEPSELPVTDLAALFRHIPQQASKEDCVRALRALRAATQASPEGLDIAKDWITRWEDPPNPQGLVERWSPEFICMSREVGLATICRLVEGFGFEWLAILAAAEPDFEVCVIDSDASNSPLITPNALDQFSLKGKRSEVQKTLVEGTYVMGRIALAGQLTVLWGPPATGKTAAAISLIRRAIAAGNVDPLKVYYLNFDDNPAGLLEKLRIAEDDGFHMLAEGYLGFSVKKYWAAQEELIASAQAKGMVVILDTLKKFTNIMDKNISAGFAGRLRQFVNAGGTCVALGHVNKHRSSDGKPIYAGTTDVLEDFDCGFLVYPVGVDVRTKTKTITFENIKARGNVAQEASYRYSVAEGISYRELVDSIVPVDEAEATSLKTAQEIEDESALIEAGRSSIRAGRNTKMTLADEISRRSGCSRRTAIRIIEKYTGDDPDRHIWRYDVRARGAKIFELLIAESSRPDPQT